MSAKRFVIRGAVGIWALTLGSATAFAASDTKNFLRFHFGVSGSAVTWSADHAVRDEFAPNSHFAGTVEMQVQRIPFSPTILWYAIAAEAFPVQAQIAHRKEHRVRYVGEGGSSAIEQEISSWVGDTVLPTLGTFNLQIDVEKKTYSIALNPSFSADPPFIVHTDTITKDGHPSLVDSGTETKTESASLTKSSAIAAFRIATALKAENQTLTSLQGQVTGTARIPIPKPSGWIGEWNIYCDLTWDLTATLPPLELDISSETYATWRPTAAPGPKAGKPIEFKARLTDLNGKPPVLKVKRFEWELAETSREPGIALNFPLASKDTSPDLRFVPATRQKADAEAQNLVFENPETYIDKAVIEPLDWGGWATLKVRAIMEDGSTVVGKMKGRPGDILLPSRAPESFIADHWKTEKGISGGDSDDDEKEPKGLPDAHGDGFTLYEEYRGFYERGKHIEGDPKRKDFFVLNLIGADAIAGIDLFEEVTGLKVHSRLRKNEMSEKTRLMNGNRAAGPNRVDQHGVWIKEDRPKETGGVTNLSKAGVAGRPGITLGIEIRPRDDPCSVFVDPYSPVSVIRHTLKGILYEMPAKDLIFSYERAIAHELLHSVGLDHHGAANYYRFFVFQHSKDPWNPSRKPRFVTYGPSSLSETRVEIGWRQWVNANSRPVPTDDRDTVGRTLTLRLEGSLRDVAAMQEAADAREDAKDSKYYEEIGRNGQEELRRGSVNRGAQFYLDWPELGHDAHYWAERDYWTRKSENLSFTLLIGEKQGEDSGPDQCLMRYYFAMAYPEPGEPRGTAASRFILIPPGTNPLGYQLCTTATGTGVNGAPKHRHGNASAGYGDCLHFVCPNDAIPGRAQPKYE